MKHLILGAACTSLLIVASGTTLTANATTVSYDVSNIAGNTWEYQYTVTNDSLATNINEFVIYFTEGSYNNISFGSTPAQWDPLVIQPDPYLPDDGFYDALALTSAVSIAPGSSLGQFTVQFNYLSAGVPSAQYFEILDPFTRIVLDNGYTQPSAVPLPAAVWMFGSGLVGLMGIAKRKRVA